MRLLLILGASAAGLGLTTLAQAGEPAGPKPQPTLGPEPRTLQIDPGEGKKRAVTPEKTEVRSPQDDLAALRRALTRVRQGLERGEIAVPEGMQVVVETGGEGRTAILAGDNRTGARFGPRLSILIGEAGAARVTADLADTSAEEILREIAALTGRQFDNGGLAGMRRLVRLRVANLPLDDTIDRLLGQLGLGWKAEVSPKGQRSIVVSERLRGLPAEVLANRAERALAEAGRGPGGEESTRRDSPVAAEAMWVLAARAQARGRQVEALTRFGAIVDEFGQSKDPLVRPWVLRSMRGVGDAMAALGQHQDARGVYREYAARAKDDDPDLPAVYLAAADSGRKMAELRKDVIAYDEAIDDLHACLERLGDRADRVVQLAQVRLAIGELLWRGGRWEEALTQLELHLKAAHKDEKDADHRIAFWMADCAYRLDRLDRARSGFLRLYRAWKGGKADPAVAKDIYAQAAFRIGLCFLKQREPQYVHALFSFMRARQDFPRDLLDAELTLAMARCYAELEREDAAVAALWELLRGDTLSDRRPGDLQLDELVAALVQRLGDYSGPVRARILFYLAQAQHRVAERDRAGRANSAGLAVGYYKRVLDEDPPAELRNAAQIGRARAALLAGQDELAVQSLRNLLREPNLGQRDRELAAQLLGNHYREKGLLREAIRAFRGEVGE